MPNHIMNIIKFNCDKKTVETIKSFMTSKDKDFDFNSLIPMPDYIFRGALGADEMKMYGTDNWFNWSIDNWGTKWNSYEVSWETNSVKFLTAWSPVPKIVKELSKWFPKVKMSYQWADEDWGYNVGAFSVKDGETSEERSPVGGTGDAYRLAFSVWDIEPSDCGLHYNKKKDTYEYRE